MEEATYLDPINGIPLLLELSAAGQHLGTATGFVVDAKGTPYLVSNYHVLSGCLPGTNRSFLPSGAIPDRVDVWFHVKNHLGTWHRVAIALLDHQGAPCWRTHPFRTDIDLAAVQFASPDDVVLYPLDLALADTDLIVLPSEPVSIVGYPFGLAAAGKFPIWKTGHVASDVALDYDGLPMFIIDATTRSGMSGSPVFARRIAMYSSSTGIQLGASALRFMGVYSGRIHRDADVGRAWKPSALSELVPR